MAASEEHMLDHDLLIELRTEFRLFREEVRAANERYIPLAKRVSDIEKLHDQFQPELRAGQVDGLLKWQEQFNTTWKIIVGAMSVAWGVIGSGMGFLIEYLLYHHK